MMVDGVEFKQNPLKYLSLSLSQDNVALAHHPCALTVGYVWYEGTSFSDQKLNI